MRNPVFFGAVLICFLLACVRAQSVTFWADPGLTGDQFTLTNPAFNMSPLLNDRTTSIGPNVANNVWILLSDASSLNYLNQAFSIRLVQGGWYSFDVRAINMNDKISSADVFYTPPTGESCVTLYTGPLQTGSSQFFTVSEYPDLTPYSMLNVVDSMRLCAKTTVRLFTGKDFSGSYYDYANTAATNREVYGPHVNNYESMIVTRYA